VLSDPNRDPYREVSNPEPEGPGSPWLAKIHGVLLVNALVRGMFVSDANQHGAGVGLFRSMWAACPPAIRSVLLGRSAAVRRRR
jgi:hypothetical protein